MDQEALQVKAVMDLRSQIQMNSFGLPIGIYRVDLLPFHDYIQDTGPQLIESQRYGTDEEPIVPATDEEEVIPDISTPEELEPLSDEELEELEKVLEEDEDEPLFDPITLEPLGYMDKTPRERTHPLITTGPTTPSEEVDHSTIGRVHGFRPEELQLAFVPITYDEGYPTFEDGDPFWTQLKYEPSEAYIAFTKYLYMSSSRPIDGSPVADTSDVKASSGIRSIAQLAAEIDPNDVTLDATQTQLKIWARLYYWDWRSAAYDMFRVVQHRAQQEIRAIELQDDHYLIGKKLTAKALEFMEDDEDFMDMLTPKVALDLLSMGLKTERVSAGLPAAGPLAHTEHPGVTPMVTVLRKVANNHRNEEEIDVTDAETAMTLDSALLDPEKTEVLQKLVLSMQGG